MPARAGGMIDDRLSLRYYNEPTDDPFDSFDVDVVCARAPRYPHYSAFGNCCQYFHDIRFSLRQVHHYVRAMFQYLLLISCVH
jgi:hypothetical protein